MATQVACWWAGAIFEVARAFGQEQRGQERKKRVKSKKLTDRPANHRQSRVARDIKTT